MDNMGDFYLKYCDITFNAKGVLKTFEPRVPADFNFAYDVVDEIARLEPGRRAMVWCNDHGEEHTFTFDDMRRYSNQAANMLAAHGIKKGDMVMLVLKRHYQFWFAVLALHKLGAVGVPATNLLTVKDYEYRFEAAGVSHIIATAEQDVTERIDQAAQSGPGQLKSKFTVRGKKAGWLDFDAEMQKYPDCFERVSTVMTDPLLLYFTSGTTGQPKMVCHDHSYPIGHIITAKFWHNVDPDGLHLTVSESGWMKSVWGKLYGQWLCGAGVFVYDMERFDPKVLLNKIAQYQITTFCAPPTVYRYLIKQDREDCDFSSVKYVTTAGEALNPEVYNRFKEYTGLGIMEAFGQTEMTVLTVNLVGTAPKVGSMGKPSPLYRVDLLNQEGIPVPPGEVGEIVIQIPEYKQIGLFGGYYKDPKLTATVWHDGYYHTGDTAWRDEDGFFWYVGRTDDIIKSSGYRIGPFEIESVLMEHPAVLECAVTGVPDEVRGNLVKATVVTTKDYAAGEELAKELQNFVKKQTAPYKYPRIVEFVEELPKTISGKIKRADIRKSR